MTSKELCAIEDLIETEKVLEAKYKVYSNMCDDPQIKAKCEEFSGKHKEHYENLLKCLNKE